MTDIENIIYPEIAFIDKGNIIEVFTRVRKGRRGKWYLWDYKWGVELNEESDKGLEKERMLAKLHFDIYMILIVGEIDTKLTRSLYDEIPLFEQDKDNKSEKNRLIEKYKLYK